MEEDNGNKEKYEYITDRDENDVFKQEEMELVLHYSLTQLKILIVLDIWFSEKKWDSWINDKQL